MHTATNHRLPSRAIALLIAGAAAAVTAATTAARRQLASRIAFALAISGAAAMTAAAVSVVPASSAYAIAMGNGSAVHVVTCNSSRTSLSLRTANGEICYTVSTSTKYPDCKDGVHDRKLVDFYSLRIPDIKPPEYYLENLYCGNNSYGFRHIEASDKGKRISNFPGGWGGFNYALNASAATWTNWSYDKARKTYNYTNKKLCLSNGTEWHQLIPFSIVVTGPKQTTGVGPDTIITAFYSKDKREPGGCPK
jgi:hypothetical protein